MFLHLICLKEIWPENLWFFLAYYISFNTIFSSLSSKFMQDFIFYFKIWKFSDLQIQNTCTELFSPFSFAIQINQRPCICMHTAAAHRFYVSDEFFEVVAFFSNQSVPGFFTFSRKFENSVFSTFEKKQQITESNQGIQISFFSWICKSTINNVHFLLKIPIELSIAYTLYTSTNMYAYEYSLQSNIVFASLYTTIKIFKGGNGIHSLDTLVMCINLYKQVVHLSYILHITTKLNNFFN